MKLAVNLASVDFRKTRMIRAALWVLSIVLIGIFAWQVKTYSLYERDADELKQNSRKVEESLNSLVNELKALGVDTSPAGVSTFSKKVSLFNQLITQKAFSWTLFLNELESAVPGNISITRLQTKFPEGIITANGKAISLKDLTQLIIRLEDSQAFQEVFLKDQTTDREGFVEFTVEFKYRSQRQAVQS